MNLPRIVLRSLRQHALSTVITTLASGLAGALMMSVWVVKDQTRAAFMGVTGGVDAVLGARGSKLQLVLNSVFHLEESPGNLRWDDYLEIAANPAVDLALPIAAGDNLRGFRIVGTLPDPLTRTEYAPGEWHRIRPPGRWFEATLREAVAGSFVAQQLGLKRGDIIHPYHGLDYNEASRHEEDYLVVGILEPSNTPADRVIWIPLEGMQNMSGHDPNLATEVSAVLLKFKADSPLTARQLDTLYNKQGDRLTFAWPVAAIVARLFDKISWFDHVLTLVAYLVAAIACGSLLASIHNSMNERRREIAILRALGARRRTVFGVIVLEAATITGLGMFVGLALYLGVMSLVTVFLRAQTGVVLDPWAWHPVLLVAPTAMIALGAMAGVIPAWKAYRTDVAENLLPLS